MPANTTTSPGSRLASPPFCTTWAMTPEVLKLREKRLSGV